MTKRLLPYSQWLDFEEWKKKRIVSRAEYERMKIAGELDPMGVYVISDFDDEPHHKPLFGSGERWLMGLVIRPVSSRLR